METEGYVSLWVSSETDSDKVQAAFEETYTDDGEWIPPPFACAFGFETFNPNTREADTLRAPTDSVREAVAGFSYDSVIADRFAGECGDALPIRATAVAMLYDFKFSGEPAVAVLDGTRWFYVGCVSYVSTRAERLADPKVGGSR